jgi:transcriptional antiterminator RfaH
VSLYPENLLERADFQALDRRWWVLYTKSRQEKALAQQLLGHEIPFYLPLVRKAHVCRGRRFYARVPVFAGYVFMYGSEQERLCSLTTNRISRILPVHAPDRLCHDLRQLFRLIACDAPLTMESRLAPGRRVRVRHGALAGLEGTVLLRRGRTRLLVAVDFLQQGASVDIEDYCLEAID